MRSGFSKVPESFKDSRTQGRDGTATTADIRQKTLQQGAWHKLLWLLHSLWHAQNDWNESANTRPNCQTGRHKSALRRSSHNLPNILVGLITKPSPVTCARCCFFLYMQRPRGSAAAGPMDLRCLETGGPKLLTSSPSWPVGRWWLQGSRDSRRGVV